jgi:hypothetical protein
MQHKLALTLFFCTLGALSCPPCHAQSDASIAASMTGLSEATGTLIGGAVGAGAALSVGTVAVTGSVAYLTIVSAGTGASAATEFTLQVPLALANRLRERAGEKIVATTDANGTRLDCGEEVIAYIPNAAKTGASGRESL